MIRNKKIAVAFYALVIGVSILAACSGSSVTPSIPVSQQGFQVLTEARQTVGGVLEPISLVTVDAVYEGTNPAPGQPGTATQSAESMPVITSGLPVAQFFNASVPNPWELVWISGGFNFCNGVATPDPVNIQFPPITTYNLICSPGGITATAVTFTPGTVYTDAPPATVTISGQGFNNTYGMPLVQYFDGSSGALLAQGYATSIASDGSWISAATPSGLSSIPSGTYEGIVSLANSDGSYSPYNVATVQVISGYPPPPPGSGCGGCSGCSGCGGGTCNPRCLAC
jgi:hypothetical protein